MNAPTIWIIFPLAAGILLLFPNNQRLLSFIGGIIAVLLAVAAQFIPLELAMNVGSMSLKIDSSLTILGRTLTIQPTEATLLALIYGAVALWFFGAEASKSATRLVPIGFMITALLVASIAVEPFLYAALFIEMAILLAVPMLVSIYEPPSKGVTRFLVYQTLAMPFILLAGWLLGGVETSPGDLALAAQSATLLGLGFAFLLAIFPLYNWIPLHPWLFAVDPANDYDYFLRRFSRPLFVAARLSTIDRSAAPGGSGDAGHRWIVRGIPAASGATVNWSALTLLVACLSPRPR